MRYVAYYILLINKNIWIPACAGMTGLGHFRTDCFAGMTIWKFSEILNSYLKNIFIIFINKRQTAVQNKKNTNTYAQ